MAHAMRIILAVIAVWFVLSLLTVWLFHRFHVAVLRHHARQLAERERQAP